MFYTALLLGFQGKYLLEGKEKLNYLISRIGQEITHARGGRSEFSPHWKLPQRLQEYVRNELPLWLYFAILAVAASALFGGFRWFLKNNTDELAQASTHSAWSASSKSTTAPSPLTPVESKSRTAM